MKWLILIIVVYGAVSLGQLWTMRRELCRERARRQELEFEVDRLKRVVNTRRNVKH